MWLTANSFSTDHYDNRPVKTKLEDFIYTFAGDKMISNVLQITGPALERHIKNARKVASRSNCKIYCIELSGRIFKEMQKRFASMPKELRRHVHLIHGDVANYHLTDGVKMPCRFEDLDLCQTLHNTKYLIAYRLQVQSVPYTPQFKDLYKCMVFTSALRPQSRTSYLKDLNTVLKVLHAGIDPHNYKSHGTKGIRMIQPGFVSKGRIVDMGIFSYSDMTPMMCTVILYK